MFVKMLVPMEGPNVSRQVGDVVPVTKKEGLRLIKAEFAEEAPDPASLVETATRVLSGVENAAAQVIQGGAAKLAAAAKGRQGS